MLGSKEGVRDFRDRSTEGVEIVRWYVTESVIKPTLWLVARIGSLGT